MALLEGLLVGGVLLMLLAVTASILSVIFWIFMLVDSIKRKYKNSDDKIIWGLVVVLLGVLGALIYYFVVKRKSKK